MTGRVRKASRVVAMVALGVAVLLSADQDGNGISTVPAAIVGLAAASVWLLARGRPGRSLDDPANDP